MARVKILFPAEPPLASLQIPVRIGDINYGGHLGNDSVLSIVHEARVQWLASAGYTELQAGGTALIMADVMVVYKGEAFYGDVLDIEIFGENVADYGFDLLYRIQTQRDGKAIKIADAKTGMVCFDYAERRIVAMGIGLRELLSGL